MSEEIWENLNFNEMTPNNIKQAYELIFQIQPHFVTAKKLKTWNSINFKGLTAHQIKNIYNNLFINGNY
jgi:hypothetical protein